MCRSREILLKNNIKPKTHNDRYNLGLKIKFAPEVLAKDQICP